MVKYRNACAVLNCQQSGSKMENLTMHSLDSGSNLGKLWYQRAKFGIISKEEVFYKDILEPNTKRIFICQTHFTDTDYENSDLQFELGLQKKKCRKRLKKSAVPTLNLPIVHIRNQQNDKLHNKKDLDILQFLNSPSTKENSPISTCKRRVSNQHILRPNKKTNNAQSCTDTNKSCTEIPTKLYSDIEHVEKDAKKIQLIQNNKHCQDVLKKLYSDEVLMDVLLNIDNRIVKAHRVILRQASGYFRQILNLDTTMECEVKLRDIEYDILVKILRYIYLGEVSMPRNFLPNFFKTAKLLDIFSLSPIINETSGKIRKNEAEIIETTEILENPSEEELYEGDEQQQSNCVFTNELSEEDVGSIAIVDSDMAAPITDISHFDNRYFYTNQNKEGVGGPQRMRIEIINDLSQYESSQADQNNLYFCIPPDDSLENIADSIQTKLRNS